MKIATTDVEIGGHVIREGEAVLCTLPAANRDPDFIPSRGLRLTEV
ncbi:hypothetical protein [Streptomyces sp. NPDC097640]